MSWFGALLATIWHHEPPPLPPTRLDERDAQIRALAAHQDRLLAELAEELDPNARRLIRSLTNDRRFLESGRDD